MKKRFLPLLMVLSLCLGLAAPSMAVGTTVKDKNGNTYTLSQPVLGTNDSFVLHDVDPAGNAWERTGTVYVVPMSTEVHIPAGITGTAILCIQYSANQWVTVAYLPLNGEAVSVPFDGPVNLPDPELGELTYRGTIQQNSTEALLIVTSSQDTAERDLGENGIEVHGDTETYLRNAVLCMVGVKETSMYAYAQMSAPTATPTVSTVTVNGVPTTFDAYNIGGANYFKLRDLAYVLSGTEKQFEVSWDGAANAISMTSGQPYTAVGGELAVGNGNVESFRPTDSKILLNGAEVALEAYNIGGNNYFKLRDLGSAFDFGVDWDGANNTVVIDTSKGYTPG